MHEEGQGAAGSGGRQWFRHPADRPDRFFHYFVASQTFVEHNAFFLERRHKSILLTDGAYVLFHVKPTGVLHTLIYVVVMILLYIIGYMIQQRWVFAPQKQNEPEVEKK